MNCYYHPNVPAVGQCKTCGRGICHDCEVEGQVLLMCKNCQAEGLPPGAGMRRIFEYKSKIEILGWPLIHVKIGGGPETAYRGIAKGIIAIGDVAKGVVALGGVSLGILFSFGGLALGGISFGGLALGGLAIGGAAIGVVAIGGAAIGYYALGGAAFGAHVITGTHRDPEAVKFFSGGIGKRILELLPGSKSLLLK